MDNDEKNIELKKLGILNVAVIGTGLMGQSIAACLLSAGHNVISIAHTALKVSSIKHHVSDMIMNMYKEGLIIRDLKNLIVRYKVVLDYNELADCTIVVESIIENLEAKQKVIQNVEAVVSNETIICSNTSALPISILQKNAKNPERILGTHWAEPAHLTRFMEVVCGEKTSLSAAEKIMRAAELWRKEPSLLKHDVRGFISNRIFYAMLREAFNIVESGIASIEDVDRSVRNDLGYWITFAGPFRFMDLTGIPAYKAVMKDLFPDLDCTKEVPKLMNNVADNGAKGVANAKGFYKYTEQEAKQWEGLFVKFSYDIRKIADKYSEKKIHPHIGNKQ